MERLLLRMFMNRKPDRIFRIGQDSPRVVESMLIDFISMTYIFIVPIYMFLVTRSTPVINSAPHTWTPPFKTPFFSCPRYQPYCCYRVESRARAREFSLPFVSARYYRFTRAQPSSYFPLYPFYIYVYRCLRDRVATLRVFL